MFEQPLTPPPFDRLFRQPICLGTTLATNSWLTKEMIKGAVAKHIWLTK
jgi:hypothetical protein